MKIENVDFREAIEILANRAGITLPALTGSNDDKRAILKAKVLEVNEQAAQFYHENLYKFTSKMAQEYIKKRKLTNQTLKDFRIGYSGTYQELYTMLKQKGFADEEILESGLVNKTDQGKYIDRYRKRLMFPICDVRGKVIAFGGRVLDDSKPKYINSPENVAYSKGRHLYGMNVAKKYSNKKIMIVEGYMDAVSLHQRGIHNVVASLGTALTEAQGRLLRRSAEQVIIGYDADGAGQDATLRGMEILQNLGCDLRVLQLDGQAKDPDEYILKYGPERLSNCMDNAISFVEFKVKLLKQNLNIENTNDKIKFLKQITAVLSKVNNDIEKEIYIDKIASEYRISKEAIYAELHKVASQTQTNKRKVEKPIQTVERKSEIDDVQVDSATKKRESLIIYLLFNYPEEAFAKIRKKISLEDIKIRRNKEILRILYEELENGNSNTSSIMDKFQEEETISYVSGIMSNDYEIVELDKCIEDLLSSYYKENLLEQRNQILKELESTEGKTEEEIRVLEKALNDIIIMLARKK